MGLAAQRPRREEGNGGATLTTHQGARLASQGRLATPSRSATAAASLRTPGTSGSTRSFYYTASKDGRLRLPAGREVIDHLGL